MNRSAIQP
jgi:hypothetical protein